jgi:hypothetical protein
MPIFGEAAQRVAEFFTGPAKEEAASPFIELSEKELKKYRNWIQLANKKHKDDVEPNAKKFIARLKQKFPDVTEDEFQSRFNYYKVNLDRTMPMLVPKEIKVKVKPVDGKDQIPIKDQNGQPQVFDNRRACVILNAKSDKVLKDRATNYEIDAAIQDLCVTNLACVVVGHTADIKTDNVAPPEAEALLAEKAAAGEIVPGEVAEKVPTITGIGKMPKLVIKHESWKNIKVDPKATDFFFANRRYAVRVVRIPLDEAKDLYGDIELTEIDEDTSGPYAKMDEAKMAVLYEVYDCTNDGEVERLTFLGEGKKCVGRTTLKYDPTVIAKLNYVSGETYPPCDMVYYEDQVDEANFYRTVGMNQSSRGAARKVIVATDTVDADNEEKLNSNKDLELVTAKLKSGQSLENVVKVIGSATISQEYANRQQSIAQDIQELSGVNATRLGQIPNSPATNATLANAAFESVTARRFAIIKEFITQILERAILVLKEVSIEQEDLMIERPDGSTEVIKWSNEDIKYAEYEVEVDLTANEPADQKLKRMLDWVNWIVQPQIMQGLTASGKKLNMFEFVKEISSYFIPNQNLDRLITDADELLDPDHENLLMLAGQPATPQDGEDFKQHIGAHSLFLQHPAMAGQEAVGAMVQQHIADTEALMNQQEELKKVEVAPTQKAGPLAAQVREAGV